MRPSGAFSCRCGRRSCRRVQSEILRCGLWEWRRSSAIPCLMGMCRGHRISIRGLPTTRLQPSRRRRSDGTGAGLRPPPWPSPAVWLFGRERRSSGGQSSAPKRRDHPKSVPEGTAVHHAEKVASGRIYGIKHDGWDVRASDDRWWVITNPTNLYPREMAPTPSMERRHEFCNMAAGRVMDPRERWARTPCSSFYSLYLMLQ